MKILLLTISLCLSLLTYSQARNGYSLSEILTEFQYEEVNTGYPDHQWVSVKLSLCTVVYNFDEDNICSSTFIIPNTLEDIAYYTNKYDKELRKISKGYWVQIAKNLNTYVEFLEDEKTGGFYFYWHP